MTMEEDDLYAFALESNYSTTEKKQSTSTTKPEETEETKENCDYAPLFHKLLVGSRSQIGRLKAENEQLKTNLENAISSGSVVVCPNCTHHFIDRQCQLRPRAMKKMRARNTVELEFSTEEDFTTWLYLNQLETNNDGLPMMMKVKKAEPKVETLKSVGSILPELVENKKEEKRPPIKLKIKRESFDKALKTLEQEKDENEQKEKELAKKKEVVRKKPEEDLKREKRAEKKKERKERKEKMKRDGEERNEQKDQLKKKPVEAIKRKLSSPDGNEKSVKTPRKDNHRLEGTKKPISARLAFPTPNTVPSAAEKAPEKQLTTVKKRESIVWDEPTVEPKVQPAAKQFHFKIPEKKITPKATNPALLLPKSKAKITFIPTAQKKAMAQSVVMNKEKQIPDPPIHESPGAPQPVTEVLSQNPCKIPETPTDVQAEQPKDSHWGLTRVKLSEAVLKHKEKHAFRRLSEPRPAPKKTIIVHYDQPSCSQKIQEQVDYKTISLKSFGISDEGIAALKLHMKNSSKNVDSTIQKLEPTDGVNKNIVKGPAHNSEASALTDQLPMQSETYDQSLLKEFFPSINIPSFSLGDRPNSQADIESESGSIVSVDDREETELLDLMREESNVQPSRDYILKPEDDADATIVEDDLETKSEGTSYSCSPFINDGYCMEDLEPEVEPDATITEGDELSENSEEEMDDLEIMDTEEADEDEVDIMDDTEMADNPLEESSVDARINEDLEEEPEEEEDIDEIGQSESVVMTSTSNPRLSSGSEKLISPMTSTPKNEDEDTVSDGEVTKPRYDDFEVEELDWNYTMDGFYDDEEEEKNEQKEDDVKTKEEPEVEKQQTTGTGELREDGEISDEEVQMASKPESPKRESPKKTKAPMRERITYVVDQKQVDIDFEDGENDVFLCSSPKRNHNTSSYRRRRSSEENRAGSSRRHRRRSRDSRDRSSYLKYKN